MKEYLLKLFVTGRTTRSERAIANLRRLCDRELAGRYELLVVDILERPHLAEEERIMATPTLVRVMPQPVRRVVGDLSDETQVRAGLDIPGGGRPSEDE
ncbi:MAG: circadian clock KaiB family protein [Desulfococcaceae bacterium]